MSIKKEKKSKIVKKDIVGLSLIESAKKEKKEWVPGRGKKREITQGLFKMWLSIPNTFRNMPDGVSDKMGIEDETIMELMKIKTQSDFGKEFGVVAQTMVDWKHEWAENGEFAATKTFFRKLTKNMIGALYRKALIEGDAQRAMAWMKIVEDWTEQFGVRHSGKVEYQLDADERAELDRVLKLNGK